MSAESGGMCIVFLMQATNTFFFISEAGFGVCGCSRDAHCFISMRSSV